MLDLGANRLSGDFPLFVTAFRVLCVLDLGDLGDEARAVQAPQEELPDRLGDLVAGDVLAN
ncbi:hypothetical protein ACP70R_010102 [Stipagrostis hirtigluma subsp. patula]